MAEKIRYIAGGTGLIGSALIERWHGRGIPIGIISRNLELARKLFPNLREYKTWDELSTETFTNAECVINLAGASIGEKKWTPEYKQVLLDSRLETTKRIAELLAPLGENAPRLLNASAIGIYGALDGTDRNLSKAFDEDTKLSPAEDFLADLGHQWELATKVAEERGVHVTKLRFGIVLSRKGGALPQFQQLAKSYLACPLGSGNQAISWIHILDLMLAFDFLMKNPELKGPINLVNQNVIKQREFLALLAIAVHRPFWELKILSKFLKHVLKIKLGSEMADLLLFKGQHVLPKRLLSKNFEFTYPNIKSALKQFYR